MIAYTGLEPARPCRRPRASTGASGSRPTSTAMRELLDPVLERAGENLGRCARPLQLGARARSVTTEVGVVSATWPSACSASTSWCCSTRPRRRAAAPAVRAAQPRAGDAGVRRRRGRVHDLGGAARGHPRRAVRRRAVAARPRRRAGARAAAQRRAADGGAAQAADPQPRRGQARGRRAAPRGSRSRSSPATPSARRSIACRR